MSAHATSKPLQIRTAIATDSTVVHSLIQAAFAEYEGNLPVPPGALNETLAEVEQAISQGCVVVAFEDTQVVGTARYQLHPDYIYVGRVAVLPSHKRLGIGKALMQYVEELAHSLGRTRLHLGTRQSIPANLAFYERLGYHIVSTEPHSEGPDINVWLEKRLRNE